MSGKEKIQDVAERLHGLRDALELTTAEVAETCGIDEATYKSYESGQHDIPISFIQTLADKYGVQVPELLFGMTPKMSSYYVTRAGKGSSVERTKAYSYQSLAEGFNNRVMHPFLVTIDPENNKITHPNAHTGQEFNYVLEGTMEFHIGANAITLNPGDSIIYSALQPHYMKALNNQKVVFLTIIAQ